ncbi:MAG: DUF2059 domain-containing protein [Allosphingosinicella sp.]|uniref:DUF2059 domain-containing protein n=1 Tax=Allosphingosinicella sp. TaxID=2823234 RepID=UPI00395B4CDD
MFARLSLLVAAFWLASPGAALAQPAATPDPEALVAAREMLAEVGLADQMEAMVLQTGNATMTTMLRQIEEDQGIELPPELEGRLRQVALEHLQDYVAAVRDTAVEDAAVIYARYFSAEELRELRRLQTHPVMVKMNRIAPQFMAEIQQVGLAEAARRLPDLQRRIGELLLDYLREQRPPGSDS